MAIGLGPGPFPWAQPMGPNVGPWLTPHWAQPIGPGRFARTPIHWAQPMGPSPWGPAHGAQPMGPSIGLGQSAVAQCRWGIQEHS